MVILIINLFLLRIDKDCKYLLDQDNIKKFLDSMTLYRTLEECQLFIKAYDFD